MQAVNVVPAVCINTLLIPGTICDMHESLQRMLEAARSATVRRPLGERVESVADLQRAMNASPQTRNNWKDRGVSKEAALQAEGLFGCSAWWILHGEHPPNWSAPAVLSPEVARVLAGDPELALTCENAIRGILRLPPLHDSGKRRTA